MVFFKYPPEASLCPVNRDKCIEKSLEIMNKLYVEKVVAISNESRFNL